MAAPPDGYALLELELGWPGLAGAEARIAGALRLFVITRDPLGWIPDRGAAWATANADGDTLELPVYVLHAELVRRSEESGSDVAAAAARLTETAVVAGSASEGVLFAGAYPELASRQRAPALLEGPVGAHALPAPTVTTVADAWEPIGLGAVQDLVQDAFGPVELDRSAVSLDPADRPQPGCPACAGESFGFPGELAEEQTRMCGAHDAQANAVTSSRIARARASNPAGWLAIAKGSARVTGAPEPAGRPIPQRRRSSPGRNDPCHCGSGRKYKHCCGAG